MRKLSDIIREAIHLPYDKKKATDDYFPEHYKNFKDEYDLGEEGYRKIGSLSHREDIYMSYHKSSYDTQMKFVTFDTINKQVVFYLSTDPTYHLKTNNFTLSNLVLAKNPDVNDKNYSKAQDLYHYLIDKHDFILVGHEQTEGSKKVWERAATMKNISSHGWDEMTSTPINLSLKPNELESGDEDDLYDSEDFYGLEKNDSYNSYRNKVADRKIVLHRKKSLKDPTNNNQFPVYQILSNYSLGQRARYGDKMAQIEIDRRKARGVYTEEAVVNSGGGGAIAGIGIGPKGEPGKKLKETPILKRTPLNIIKNTIKDEKRKKNDITTD